MADAREGKDLENLPKLKVLVCGWSLITFEALTLPLSQGRLSASTSSMKTKEQQLNS
jgi:hypothetical protein